MQRQYFIPFVFWALLINLFFFHGPRRLMAQNKSKAFLQGPQKRPPSSLEKKLPQDVFIKRLFVLTRINYKPYKILLYDARIHNSQDKRCAFYEKDPLDVYYLRITPRPFKRLKMSSSSQEYFNPKDIKLHNSRYLTFSFKALQEFDKHIMGTSPIHLELEESNGTCKLRTFSLYQGKKFELQNIKIHFNKFLGLIIGLDYVFMVGKTEKGTSPIQICVQGQCPTLKDSPEKASLRP